jgi:hypothetical protein
MCRMYFHSRTLLRIEIAWCSSVNHLAIPVLTRKYNTPKGSIHRLVTNSGTQAVELLRRLSPSKWLPARVLWQAHCWARPWPPQSPDLTLPDFCPCGPLKERDYANKPRSMEELKHNTKQTVTNTEDRANMFLQNVGIYLQVYIAS